MTRKLLPYEYDLIDALGVTKEEYLDFVAQQHVHEDIKDGTIFDIRSEPAAIILFVVGVLLQAVSLLLLPKIPDQKGTPQTRDQRLSPRSGFNGSQELAVYGESVPLVYTNTAFNRSGGGVRVSTLLLWSAILSFGNNQSMQLMAAIGAARIVSIDPDRTAIGQLPAKDIALSGVWQYYNSNGATRYRDQVFPDDASATDPRITTGTDYTAMLMGLPDAKEGFSQSFSPTTSNKVGMDGFIPVNADVLILTDGGSIERKLVEVSFKARGNVDYWPDSNSRPTVPIGSRWTLNIADTKELLLTTDISGLAAQDALRASAATIDNGSLFKAGSAIFRVVSTAYADNKSSIEESNLRVEMECIRAGKMPRLPYGVKHWQDAQEEAMLGNEREIQQKSAEIAKIEGEINLIRRDLDRGYYNPRTGSVFANAQYRLISSAERTAFENNINKKEDRIGSIKVEINQLEGERAVVSTTPFYTKGLARIQEAAYASITKCNVLDLVIKFSVYRRINGRSSRYGSGNLSYGHSSSDNGVKPRTSMFALWYRFNNTGKPRRLPYIFCCRGVNEQTIFTYLKLVSKNEESYIEVRLEPVIDTFIEKRTGFNLKGYCYLSPLPSTPKKLSTTQTGNANLEVFFNGSIEGPSDYPPINKSPRDSSEFDAFNYDAFTSSTFSFDSSTEIQITSVNEQIISPWKAYSDSLYQGLSILSLHLMAGSGTQDVRDTSVWVTEGKKLRLLSVDPDDYATDSAITAFARSDTTASSSYAPDIFIDTILDSNNGIGRYATLHSVDMPQLAISKRYCRRNGLFMDGVIADQRSWRDFWSQVAPFSLLELGKIGGKETLVPALPYNRSNGDLTRNIDISALFNTGNILEDSYKEEFVDYGANTQDAIITVVYRDVERNGIFPRNNSVEVQRSDAAEAIRETVDASQFVTTRKQAIKIAKYLCNTRHYNRRAIEFKTFPTDSFVAPGSYIYVETANNQWDGIYTGRIEAGGVLNVPVTDSIRNGAYTVLTYSGTNGTRSFNNVSVSNGTAAALSSRAGDLFVLGKTIRNKRVFRITEVSMEEEGETTVRGVEHPCNSAGLSLIAEGISAYVAGVFTIDGDAE